jgi:hypothetical protein
LACFYQKSIAALGSSYSMCTRSSFPGVKRSWGHVEHSSHLVLRLRVGGAVPPFPPHVFTFTSLALSLTIRCGRTESSNTRSLYLQSLTSTQSCDLQNEAKNVVLCFYKALSCWQKQTDVRAKNSLTAQISYCLLRNVLLQPVDIGNTMN